MKNYIVSLSKRALLLSGALAIFTACDDGDLGDIYKGNSSGEYVSDVNWTDAADKSTGTYIKYFYENASGRDTFCGSIYWEKPNTPETGEPASTGGSGGWSQGHALDIVIDAYIRHANNPEYQAHLYENIMKPFLPAFDDWNEHCGYGGKDFWNNFYDDMEWMALSCLRVYELTGDQDYYSALMKMWNHIKGAKNDYKGVGGMAWKTDAPASRMSCSNGPGCLLAMKLYQLTVKEAKDGWEEQAAYYLNFAKEVYNWMTAYLCDISTGQVYDNLSIKDDGTPGDPDKVALSYNQGTFMAAALELYNATGEDEYLRLRPKESWDRKLRRLMAYFEEDTQLRDILITGGDALMSQNKTLQNILDAVYRMAARKQRANLERKDGEKYAELQRVRLGSRLLAYLPMRINDGLVDILREFKEKASAIGVKQFIIQTHFQTPLEVTPEAKEAIRKILSAGWIITNQLVYTVAASRRGHTTRLRQVLNSLGVVCYYTFSVKGFNENYAVFAPNSRSMQEQQEEKIYGRMTPEQAEELYKILETKAGTEEEPKEDVAKQLRRFMRKHHLPFLATDRSVLNLPAIGKSMTFQLVGLTEEGKRILRFEHDGTRHHSPIIDQMGQIYIVENKSLAAYLRQLAKMGEDPEDYASIWNYTKGETEPRFSLYEYPDFPFRTTDKMSNLSIKD